MTDENFDWKLFLRNKLAHLQNKLAHLLCEEEMKWYQRAKYKDLLHGDSNTKYFKLVASGKHRKSRIFKLRDGDHVIQGDVALKKHITSYYKNLFGPPNVTGVDLDETRIKDIPQVSEVENDFLVSPFSVEEIHNKAPGPNGFPMDFFNFLVYN